jgi:hypothetical protein
VILRFRYQNISSLVIFVVDGDGDGDETRHDRVRLIGKGGMLEKTGQDSTLEPTQVRPQNEIKQNNQQGERRLGFWLCS